MQADRVWPVSRPVLAIDLERGLLQVQRHTYPGHGGLVTKTTKGRRHRTVPIIEALRPTLARLTVGRDVDERLVTGLVVA